MDISTINNRMTKKQLIQLCKDNGIKGYSKYNKAQLIEYTKQKMIEKYPENNNHENHNHTEEHDCSICLDSIETHNKKTLECGHVFCKSCINHWCRINSTCPYCRKPIKKERVQRRRQQRRPRPRQIELPLGRSSNLDNIIYNLISGNYDPNLVNELLNIYSIMYS